MTALCEEHHPSSLIQFKYVAVRKSRARFIKQGKLAWVQFQKSTDGSGTFCVWSAEEAYN